MKKIFDNLFNKNKKTEINIEEKIESEKLEKKLLEEMEKLMFKTKDLDYLREEVENVSKGKSEIEILESLAQAFNKKEKKDVK